VYGPRVDAGRIVAIITPLIAVQVMLIAIALRDLTLPERRVRIANKVVWAMVIVFLEVLGPALYFMAGREPE